MYEKTVKKSETITKRDCDEWIDGEGKFHRRIIFETITSPMDLDQAINPMKGRFSRHLKPARFPRKSFWSPMKPSDNEVLDEFINSKFPERPRMNFNEFMGEQKKIIDSKLPEKPAIDVKEFIEKGRKILSGMGIDVENEIKNLFTKPKEETKTDLKKEEETLNQEKEVKIKWKIPKKPLKKQKQKKQNQKKKK